MTYQAKTKGLGPGAIKGALSAVRKNKVSVAARKARELNEERVKLDRNTSPFMKKGTILWRTAMATGRKKQGGGVK